LFSGYHRLPEKTREKLRDGWYATGDMGFVSEGELYVTGRIDDMLIVNGRNYYAHEIESIINSIPSIIAGRNVAICVHDSTTDAATIVVLAECEAPADHRAVEQRARHLVLERLGIAIHSLVPIEPGRLVKTTSGKISRDKNTALYLKGDL
jgi:fatty-acyl-CoA synthase